MITGLAGDIRFAWALYRRTPIQSAMAVITIAVSMGLSIAFFSLYNNLAFSPPAAVSNPATLVDIGLSDGQDFQPVGRHVADAVAARSRSLATLARVRYEERDNVPLPDRNRDLRLGLVDGTLFAVLGVQAADGRLLDMTDMREHGGHVAVISHALMRQHFGKASSVLGQEIRIEKQAFRVVGVAPPGFVGPHRDRPVDVWLPNPSYSQSVAELDEAFLTVLPMRLIGRLAANASPQTVEEELGLIADRLPASLSADIGARHFSVSQAFSSDPARQATAERQLKMFLATAILLVAVAAGNVSLFFLARIPRRQREMGIRLAVGGTKPRIMRQLFTESALLVVAGAVIAVVMSLWFGLLLERLPFLADIHWREQSLLDVRVLAFALSMTLLTAGLASLAPMRTFQRRTVSEQASAQRTRIGLAQRLIALFQIGMAAVVLTVTLFFSQALFALIAQPPGYDPAGVTVLEVRPQDEGSFSPDVGAIRGMHHDIRERLGGMAQVQAVAFASHVPTASRPGTHRFEPEQALVDRIDADGLLGDADWLQLLSVPLLHGNLPETGDDYAAVVNRQFAQQAWGETDVVGRWIHPPARFGGGEDAFRVAAVIDNLHFDHPADRHRPMVLVNRRHMMGFLDSILIRGRLSDQQAKEAIAPILNSYSPPLHVSDHYSLQSRYAGLIAGDRSRTALSGVAALLVIGLALLGYFGMLHFMVASGRYEFAVRAAMGAGPARLRRHVIASGLLLALPGLVSGLLLSVLVVAMMRAPFDLADQSLWPAVLTCGPMLLLFLCLAVIPPAREAASRPPGPALRAE